MTWVSERSGIASSGVSGIPRTPKSVASTTNVTVRIGFFAQAAISLAIMRSPSSRQRRLELTLGGDQEVPRRHDHLPRSQAALDRVPVARSRAEDDFARNDSAIWR